MDTLLLRVRKDDRLLLIGVLEHAIHEGQYNLDHPKGVAWFETEAQSRRHLEILKGYVAALKEEAPF